MRVSDSREEKVARTEMGRPTLRHPKVILPSLRDKRGGMFILSLPRREGERHDKETDALLTGADRGCGGVDGLRGGPVGGLGGDDNMFGHFGHDEIYGGEGTDFLLGDEDYDYPDTLLGNDTLFGGPGNDDLRGAFGNDKIYGGEGDDFVFAYDQLNVTTGADVVDCGRGLDTVHYDKGVDKIRHCEIKVRTTQN